MRILTLIVLSALFSVIVGAGAGLIWAFGNYAAGKHVIWLILLAVPSNLVASLSFYLAIRGTTHAVKGGAGLALLACGLNMLVTIPVAYTILDLTGAGTAKIGANTFTWGMAFAYGQAFKDARAAKWFGD